MKADMLVKLYDLPDVVPGIDELKKQGISIKRAIAPDKHRIVQYVKETFSQGWASECDVSFSNHPVSCYIAVKDKKIVGFACYDATAKNFFGPTGVTSDYRGKGIGRALLLKCLLSMREQDYGYAIIGGVELPGEFYVKTANAVPIDNSFPGIYGRLIKF
jgi:predicted GNAT family acetyltransferase